MISGFSTTGRKKKRDILGNPGAKKNPNPETGLGLWVCI
jgi:hypothetical protein